MPPDFEVRLGIDSRQRDALSMRFINDIRNRVVGDPDRERFLFTAKKRLNMGYAPDEQIFKHLVFDPAIIYDNSLGLNGNSSLFNDFATHGLQVERGNILFSESHRPGSKIEIKSILSSWLAEKDPRLSITKEVTSELDTLYSRLYDTDKYHKIDELRLRDIAKVRNTPGADTILRPLNDLGNLLKNEFIGNQSLDKFQSSPVGQAISGLNKSGHLAYTAEDIFRDPLKMVDRRSGLFSYHLKDKVSKPVSVFNFFYETVNYNSNNDRTFSILNTEPQHIFFDSSASAPYDSEVLSIIRKQYGSGNANVRINNFMREIEKVEANFFKNLNSSGKLRDSNPLSFDMPVSSSLLDDPVQLSLFDEPSPRRSAPEFKLIDPEYQMKMFGHSYDTYDRGQKYFDPDDPNVFGYDEYGRGSKNNPFDAYDFKSNMDVDFTNDFEYIQREHGFNRHHLFTTGMRSSLFAGDFQKSVKSSGTFTALLRAKRGKVDELTKFLDSEGLSYIRQKGGRIALTGADSHIASILDARYGHLMKSAKKTVGGVAINKTVARQSPSLKRRYRRMKALQNRMLRNNPGDKAYYEKMQASYDEMERAFIKASDPFSFGSKRSQYIWGTALGAALTYGISHYSDYDKESMGGVGNYINPVTIGGAMGGVGFALRHIRPTEGSLLARRGSMIGLGLFAAAEFTYSLIDQEKTDNSQFGVYQGSYDELFNQPNNSLVSYDNDSSFSIKDTIVNASIVTTQHARIIDSYINSDDSNEFVRDFGGFIPQLVFAKHLSAIGNRIPEFLDSLDFDGSPARKRQGPYNVEDYWGMGPIDLFNNLRVGSRISETAKLVSPSALAIGSFYGGERLVNSMLDSRVKSYVEKTIAESFRSNIAEDAWNFAEEYNPNVASAGEQVDSDYLFHRDNSGWAAKGKGSYDDFIENASRNKKWIDRYAVSSSKAFGMDVLRHAAVPGIVSGAFSAYEGYQKDSGINADYTGFYKTFRGGTRFGVSALITAGAMYGKYRSLRNAARYARAAIRGISAFRKIKRSIDVGTAAAGIGAAGETGGASLALVARSALSIASDMVMFHFIDRGSRYISEMALNEADSALPEILRLKDPNGYRLNTQSMAKLAMNTELMRYATPDSPFFLYLKDLNYKDTYKDTYNVSVGLSSAVSAPVINRSVQNANRSSFLYDSLAFAGGMLLPAAELMQSFSDGPLESVDNPLTRIAGIGYSRNFMSNAPNMLHSVIDRFEPRYSGVQSPSVNTSFFNNYLAFAGGTLLPAAELMQSFSDGPLSSIDNRITRFFGLGVSRRILSNAPNMLHSVIGYFDSNNTPIKRSISRSVASVSSKPQPISGIIGNPNGIDLATLFTRDELQQQYEANIEAYKKGDIGNIFNKITNVDIYDRLMNNPAYRQKITVPGYVFNQEKALIDSQLAELKEQAQLGARLSGKLNVDVVKSGEYYARTQSVMDQNMSWQARVYAQYKVNEQYLNIGNQKEYKRYLKDSLLLDKEYMAKIAQDQVRLKSTLTRASNTPVFDYTTLHNANNQTSGEIFDRIASYPSNSYDGRYLGLDSYRVGMAQSRPETLSSGNYTSLQGLIRLGLINDDFSTNKAIKFGRYGEIFYDKHLNKDRDNMNHDILGGSLLLGAYAKQMDERLFRRFYSSDGELRDSRTQMKGTELPAPAESVINELASIAYVLGYTGKSLLEPTTVVNGKRKYYSDQYGHPADMSPIRQTDLLERLRPQKGLDEASKSFFFIKMDSKYFNAYNERMKSKEMGSGNKAESIYMMFNGEDAAKRYADFYDEMHFKRTGLHHRPAIMQNRRIVENGNVQYQVSTLNGEYGNFKYTTTNEHELLQFNDPEHVEQMIQRTKSSLKYAQQNPDHSFLNIIRKDLVSRHDKSTLDIFDSFYGKGGTFHYSAYDASGKGDKYLRSSGEAFFDPKAYIDRFTQEHTTVNVPSISSYVDPSYYSRGRKLLESFGWYNGKQEFTVSVDGQTPNRGVKFQEKKIEKKGEADAVKGLKVPQDSGAVASALYN